MAMTYDQYQNRRSWLVDTAETPADKKKLASDLAKLDAQYKASKAAKGTQTDHHVTDNNSHTQTVKPSVPLPPEGAKRPMVGTDKPAAKKYGSKSWNNGYTN